MDPNSQYPPQSIQLPSKPKSKINCVLFILIIFCCLILTGIIAAAVYFIGKIDFKSDDEKDKNKNGNGSGTVVVGGSDYESGLDGFTIENIPDTTPTQIMIPEVDLGLDALDILEDSNWNGERRSALPIQVSDFDQKKLQEYIDYDIAGDEKLTIPDEDEDLYLSTQSEDDLAALVLSARQEYLDYLKSKGVQQKYITEIENNVLPEDRINYHAENNPDSDWSRTEAIMVEGEMSKDYRKLVMHIYPVDIYNRVRTINNAKLFGEPQNTDEYKIKVRDAATRLLIYHEMTHVLQQAYVNVWLPEKYNESGIKSVWVYAEKKLMDIDDQYYWEWGGEKAVKDMNNHDVSDESQAEGVCFEVFINIYKLSDEQSNALWAHYFDRLSNEQQNLEKMRQKFESNYPEYEPQDFGSALADVVKNYSGSNSKTLKNIASRLIALPAYVGYLNPMKPQDADKFWDALKN